MSDGIAVPAQTESLAIDGPRPRRHDRQAHVQSIAETDRRRLHPARGTHRSRLLRVQRHRHVLHPEQLRRRPAPPACVHRRDYPQHLASVPSTSRGRQHAVSAEGHEDVRNGHLPVLERSRRTGSGVALSIGSNEQHLADTIHHVRLLLQPRRGRSAVAGNVRASRELVESRGNELPPGQHSTPRLRRAGVQHTPFQISEHGRGCVIIHLSNDHVVLLLLHSTILYLDTDSP
mmetsp:Transcript_15903/g.43955  ORF Transcript_15903/g.43955 Transcript_15903/m.43955 type:complete len:232 (+) Transcript_15903:368-1063(+)